MKSKFLLLLKMQLYGFAGINYTLHSKNPKDKQNRILWDISLLSILVLLVIYSALTSIGIAQMGMSRILPAMSVLLCSLISLLLSFLKSMGALIGLRDYDMVMSLPVKNYQIVMSRLSMIYFTNFVLSLIVSLPAIIIYGVSTRSAAVGYTIFFLSVILSPVIPMIFALGTGLLIVAISSRFRCRNTVSLIFITIVVLVATFGAIHFINVHTSQIADISLEIFNITNRIYPPSAMVSNAVINCNWVMLLTFAVLSLAIGATFVGTVSHFYKRLNTLVFSQHTRTGYAQHKLKTNTPVTAMYKREFHRYFSCTIYVLNSSIGMIFLLVMAIMLQFIPIETLDEQIGIAGLKEALEKILPMLPAVFIGICSTTSASLSLEGKTCWIMCSVPIRGIDIFHAKIALNLTIILPFAFISCILLRNKIQISLLNLLFLFLIPTVYAFFISVIGMFLNAKFPMYNWTSEYYVVKGLSISVLATSMTGLLSSVLPLLLCIILPAFSEIIMGVVSVTLVLLTLILYGKLRSSHLYIVWQS